MRQPQTPKGKENKDSMYNNPQHKGDMQQPRWQWQQQCQQSTDNRKKEVVYVASYCGTEPLVMQAVHRLCMLRMVSPCRSSDTMWWCSDDGINPIQLRYILFKQLSIQQVMNFVKHTWVCMPAYYQFLSIKDNHIGHIRLCLAQKFKHPSNSVQAM